MKNQIFREKSIQRVSSPEQLNDYIRVANPGVWMIMIGIVLVLVGICVWGVFGQLDTLLTVGAVTGDDHTVCYVRAEDISRIDADMTVRLGEDEYEIAEIALQPTQVGADFPPYLLHVGGLSEGEWVYAVHLRGAHGTSGGIFTADIVIESIAPVSFLIN